MKNLLLLPLFLCSLFLLSQNSKYEKPDYKKIEREIKKKNSDYYYPKLLSKFHAADSLTLEEKRHLYYGFQFQKEYSPSYNSAYQDSLRPLLKKENLTEAEFKKLYEYSNLILKEDPLNLKALVYKTYSSTKLNIGEEMKKSLSQFQSIIGAIMSSGNGLSKESAFYVIRVSDEYEILNILDFKFGGKQSLIGTYDYLEVVENPYKVKGLYFEISPSLFSLLKK